MNAVKLEYTSTGAAKYLGVSLATIRNWTDSGQMPHYRTPGGQRRFSEAQLDEFMSRMLTTDKKLRKVAL